MPSLQWITCAARAGLLAPLALASASPAAASAITIDPVRVDLTDERKIGALRLVNRDAEPVSVRVIALRWEQRDGVDIYTETTDLIASPPVFTVPPGGAQLLRVGLRDNDTGRFRAYRLIVEELPRLSEDGSAIRITVKLNLPLYALPKLGKASSLAWARVQGRAEGEVIEASNTGDQPVRVQQIDAVLPSGKHVTLSTSLGVVLPGSKRRWVLGTPPSIPAFFVQGVARTNAGDQPFQLAAARP